MEGKPCRGSRGGAKSRKKKFLKKLAARWGQDCLLPRIKYDAADPTIPSLEVDWELVNSLDTLVVHVLACTVPRLKDLLDRLNFSVDRKPKLAPGDGPPSPPRGPNVPTHEDWDAVRDDPALAARLAAYDPSDDEPQGAGAGQHRRSGPRSDW